MDTYRLLRNNKASGPFTKEELVASGLKPYDLVWIENKSSAWRYPEEIEALKAFAAHTPLNSFAASEPPKVKPRFKITATSRKIEFTPTENVVSNQPSNVIATPTTSGSLAVLNQHINSQTSLTKTEEPVLEKKYERSLEDIKRTYEETILRPAASKRKYLRYAWLLAIPLLGLAFWGGYKISVKPGEVITALTTGITTVKENEKDAASEQTLITNIKQEQHSPQQLIVEPTKISPYDLLEEKTEQKPAAKKIFSNAVMKSGSEETVTPDVPKSIPASETVRKEMPRATEQIRTEMPVKTNPVVIAAPAVPKAIAGKSKRTSDYVMVDGDYSKNGNVIQNLSLKVENVTPYALDLVVLDIQYFDRNGRLQKGETVYAKNIAPRRDVIVSAPSGSNAYSVGYKVSLISAEKAGVYLVAD